MPPDSRQAACRSPMDALRHVFHIQRHSRYVAGMARRWRRCSRNRRDQTPQDLWPCPSRQGCCSTSPKSYTSAVQRQPLPRSGASWVIDSTGNHKVAQAVYHHAMAWPLAEISLHPVSHHFTRTSWARHEMVSTGAEDLLVRYGKRTLTPPSVRLGTFKTIDASLSGATSFLSAHESTVVGGRLCLEA